MVQGGVVSTTRATIADIAKKAARQVIEEPAEILKTGSEQAFGGRATEGEKPGGERKSEKVEKSADFDQEKRAQDDARFMKALEAEIVDIRKRRDQEILLARKKEEEEKARLVEEAESKEVPAISSKPSRRFGSWVRGLSKGIETRKPPTG